MLKRISICIAVFMGFVGSAEAYTANYGCPAGGGEVDLFDASGNEARICESASSTTLNLDDYDFITGYFFVGAHEYPLYETVTGNIAAWEIGGAPVADCDDGQPYVTADFELLEYRGCSESYDGYQPYTAADTCIASANTLVYGNPICIP